MALYKSYVLLLLLLKTIENQGRYGHNIYD